MAHRPITRFPAVGCVSPPTCHRRMRCTSLASLTTCMMMTLAAVLFANASSSFAQVTFQWKIPDGVRRTTKQTANTQQVMKLNGQNLETKSEQTMIVVAQAGKRADDGSITVEKSVESLQASLTMPLGVNIQYDSANPAPAAGGGQFSFIVDAFQRLSDADWKIVYDRNNRPQQVTGTEEVLEGAEDNVKSVISAQLDAKNLLNEARQEMEALPDQPVQPGATWKRKVVSQLGNGQTMQFDMQYRYQGAVSVDGKTLDKITYQVTDVQYRMDEDPSLPFKVAESEIEVAQSAGQLLFDRSAGWVASTETSVKLDGTLTLEIAGTKYEADLSLSIDEETVIN